MCYFKILGQFKNMAKERIVGTLQISGKLANTVYFRRKGETISRTLVIPSNPKYRKQMLNRVGLANLVFIYNALKPAISGAFETKRPHESDYNAFIRRNKVGYGDTSVRFPLTKEESYNKYGYPDRVTLSDGSLPPMTYSFDSDSVTDITFNMVAGTYTTVDAAFKALMDQTYGTEAQSMGMVYAIAYGGTGSHLYGITGSLNYAASASELSAAGFVVVGEAGSQTLGFKLKGAPANAEMATFGAYGSKVTTSGKVVVSLSNMVGNSGFQSYYDKITEEDWWQKAIDSYGWNEAPLSRDAAEPKDI